MSGLAPMNMKKGGFPDLTGDGKVTQADILKGRGVEGFAEGGDADKSFYNLQKTAPGTGLNLRSITDFLFDPTDPVDYLVLGMMAFPPAGIAAKLVQAGIKGKKLRDTLKKVEAAKGLTLGPTRESLKGKAGQLLVRQEIADLFPHNKSEFLIPGLGGEKALGKEQYSYEMRDYLKENPDYTYEEGLPGLIETVGDIGSLGKEFYDIAKDPKGREVIAEEIKGIPSVIAESVKDADYSRYNPLELLPDSFTKRPSELDKKAEGGIMMLTKGGDALEGGLNLGRAFLNKVKNNPKLQNKDGSPKKSTKEYKTEVARIEAAKKKAAAKKRAETRRRNQEAKAREEAERQGRLDRAEANRAKDRAEFEASRPPVQGTGASPTDPTFVGPTMGGRINRAVDESLDASRQAGSQAPKAADDVIPEGAAGDQRTLLQRINPYTSFNIFNPATKAKGTKTVGAIALASQLIPGGDGSDEDRPLDTSDDGTFVTDDPVIASGGTTPPPVTDDSLAYYVKQDLAGKGFDFDPQTQTFTGDKKPSFFDYVKSLPAGYMEKVGDDPDYAKKMMAGFLNMMKPVEGFVPVNPVVAFGEGYLGEETRQADMLPADAKLLEYFRDNPEAYERMLSLEGARAGTIGDVDPEQAQEQYDTLKRSLMGSKFNADDYPDLEVRYKHPQYGDIPVTAATLMAMRGRGEGFFGDPNLYLKRK